MKSPTQRQKEVLDFLIAFLCVNHRQPTTREIASQFGYKSQTASISVLRALEKKGHIETKNGHRRIVGMTIEVKFA